MTGKHIELFLVEGVPGGITTAEIAGWTGHVLAGPRSDLGDVLKRPEARRNGAYLLLGDDEEALGGTRCYIGRTEDFINRFRDHSAKKDFWDRVVLITSKDDSFTEGHWGYLEWRLVELAKQAARVTLANGNNPQGRKLSEAQMSDMEAFLEQLQIVLPVLGVNAIRIRPATTPNESATAPSPVFTLMNANYRVDAQAQQIGDEFTMLEGSQVVAVWAGTGKAESTKRAYAAYRAQHRKLVADGSIELRGDVGILTRDIPFSSPSTAAAVALGRSSNGRLEWKCDDGTSYGEWENRGVE
ncbi:MAG: GIY-YIG nuclease family protein [Coriobacteriia bacterium]|nr:GIY-YIG nuclease family protein [Coriobacteriia bacterium]